MKPFKTVAIVKHHPNVVSSIVRDRLPDLVSLLDDIEQITVIDRVEASDGTVRLVNHWKANPPIPPMLASVIDPSMLAWLDRAEWHSSGSRVPLANRAPIPGGPDPLRRSYPL